MAAVRHDRHRRRHDLSGAVSCLPGLRQPRSPPQGAGPSLPGPGPVVPPGPVAPPGNPSLTGVWMSNDGGTYFLRHIGDELWWAGMSGGLMYPGTEFCNVFHGSVTGGGVTGEWSAVPRGALHGRGTLTLRSAGDSQLLRVVETGGFGGSIWRRASATTWPVVIIDQEFTRTLKNVVGNWDVTEKTTLADNLAPLVNSTKSSTSCGTRRSKARYSCSAARRTAVMTVRTPRIRCFPAGPSALRAVPFCSTAGGFM